MANQDMNTNQPNRAAQPAGPRMGAGEGPIAGGTSTPGPDGVIGQTPLAFPALPYEENALEPVISARAISFHYGKHHKTYVDKGLQFVKGTDLEGASMERMILESFNRNDRQKIFNNAAQAWNHTFQWNCLVPRRGAAGPNRPSGALLAKIDEDFNGFDAFRQEMITQGRDHFGSGWVWLVSEGNKLRVTTTHDAGNPMTSGQTPLLTIDLWEHAYYLDYQNKREEFLTAVVDSLLNWEFAAANFQAARNQNRPTH